MEKDKIPILKNTAGIFLLFLIVVFCVTSASFASEDAVVEAIQYRIKGYVFQRQGDYSRAIENYKKAIERYPFYACAYNDLGILYEQRGLTKAAEEQYLIAVKIDPTYASVYTNLASLYERLQRFQEASYYWQIRVRMGSPNDQWTLHAKERYRQVCQLIAQQEGSKSAAAQKEPKRARKTTKDRRVQKSRLSVEKPAEAAKPGLNASQIAERLAYEKSVEKEKNLKELRKTQKLEDKCRRYMDCAEEFVKKGNYDSAIRQYNKVKNILPDYPNIDELIKEAQNARIEKKEQARLRYDKERQVKQEDKRSREDLYKRETTERRQKKKVATPDEKTRQKIDVLLNKAEDYIAGHKYDVAIKQYRMIGKLDPDYPGLDNLIKRAEDEKSGYEIERKAQAQQERFLKEQEKKRQEQERISKKIEGYLAKADAYLSKGRYESAISCYKKISWLNPDYPGLQGLIDNARKLSEKPEKSKKEDVKLRAREQTRRLENQRQEEQEKLKGQQQQEQARLEKVQKEAEKKQQETLKEAQRHFTRGQNLYLAGKYEKAIRELKLVLAVDPNHIEANRLMRYCQRRTQKVYYRPLEEAVSKMESAVSAQPAVGVTAPAIGPPAPVPQAAAQQAAVPEAPAEIERRISQEVQKEERASSGLTAADIEKKYQIMGVVAYRSEVNDISALNDELLKKAKLMGAEEVIQVRYFQHNNYIYGYGTAVKKKK